MALVVKERIKETTATSGTGTLTLSGAVNGFRPFSDLGNNNTTFYCITDDNNNTFEVGLGTYNANTLTRDTVFQTSSGNTTKINFASGNKEVFVTYVAEKSVHKDANGDIDTTGKIKFANVYSQTSDLPSASTYHGMFAHVHGTGKAYFAHAGNWVELQNSSEVTSAIDSHLNVSSASTNQYLQWSGSDYQWAGVSGYSDSDVDTHLNQSSASSNQFLKWNGSDYSWAVPTDTNTTYSAGSGIDLSGTTFSHSDTSSQSSSNNSGRTYIQDITLDTYGHVTGIATATETVTNTDTTYTGGSNITVTGNNVINLDTNPNVGNVYASRYYLDGVNVFIDTKSGNYGSIRVEGGSYEGYAIRDDWVFMSNTTDYCGIYNDTDNEWCALFYRNGRVELRENGTETFRTTSDGVHIRQVSSSGVDATIVLGSSGHAKIYNDAGSAFSIRSDADEYFIYANENSYTYLYHNGNWRMRTEDTGIIVRGSNQYDGIIYLGTSAHAKLVNDEGSYVKLTTGANENFIYGQENGTTYLYHNGTWKLKTASTGITFTGALSVGGVDSSYGSSGQVLTSNGNASPSWQDAGGGGWEFVSGVRARHGSEGSIISATFNNIERNAMYMMLIWDWYIDVNNTSQYTSNWVPTIQLYFDHGYGWNKNASNGTLGWYQSSRNRSYNSTTNSNSSSFNQAGAYLNASYTPTRTNTVPPLMYVVYFNNSYYSDFGSSASFKYEWRYQYFGNNGYRSQDGFGNTYQGIATDYDTHAQSIRLTTRNGSTYWHGQVALYKAKIS